MHSTKVNPMKVKSPDSSQTSFLMNGLSEQLNPRHPIYQLNKIIDWESLETDFTRLYSRRGRPAKPVRLMISLLLLKQLHDLSDDQVVEGWIENPYWQFLSGEHELQWSAPIAFLAALEMTLHSVIFSDPSRLRG
jgi:transposase, IS5 family